MMGKVTYYSAPGIPKPKQLEDADKIDIIINNACLYYDITFEELASARKTDRVVIPRHIIWYLIKKNTSYGTVKIGKRFKKDHATIINGIRNIRNMIEMNVEDEILKALSVIGNF